MNENLEEYLRRTAKILQFKLAQGTLSKKRAEDSAGEAALSVRDRPERWAIELLEGDQAEVLLVRFEEDGYVGSCSCSDFRSFSWPCAHLIELTLGEGATVVVPEDRELAACLAFGTDGGIARPQLPVAGGAA